MFLSEKQGIKKLQIYEDGFSFKEFSIKYPNYRNFLELDKDTTTSNSSKKVFLEITKTIIPIQEDTLTIANLDSIPQEKLDTLKSKQNFDFSKIDTTTLTRIAYPVDNPNFIVELKDKLSSKECRIIHYGDSQIEGDRITGYLRNRLQKMYGGSGPGFIPIKQVYDQLSAKVTPSQNWLRYAKFDPNTTKFNHKKYGLYLSASRFTKYNKLELDSINIDSLPVEKASILISKSKNAYNKFKKFTKIGLHYGECNTTTEVLVYDNDLLIQKDTLISDGNYHQYVIKTKTTPTNLRIELNSKISPDFYGLTLDAGAKVQIDNVAMRGSSGVVFSGTNNLAYQSMARSLKPKIIIMQYGGNTLPYLKDSLGVDRYAKNIVRQINWVKNRTSKVNFIYVGPTDMSTPINGVMETYPLLPYFNKKLKETCLENNIAYWSMFDAMGGKGSMKLWVENKLAGKDYTHFTYKGSKVISELFFTSLYLDIK